VYPTETSGATGVTLDLDRTKHLGILDVLFRVDVALPLDSMNASTTPIDIADAPKLAMVLKVGNEHLFEIPATYGQVSANIVSFLLSGPMFRNMDGFPLFAACCDEIHLTITSDVKPVNVYVSGYIFNPDTKRSLVARHMSLLHAYTREFEVAMHNDTIDITKCLQGDITQGGISIKLTNCSDIKLESIVVWVSGWNANVLLAGLDCLLEGSEWVLCEEMLHTTLLKKATEIKLQFIYNGPIAPISSVLVKIKCLRKVNFHYGCMGIESFGFS